MALVFVDSSVLIDAIRGAPDMMSRALAFLNDSAMQAASGDMVEMEVMPKAVYNGRKAEVEFYTDFFEQAVLWVSLTPELAKRALEEGMAAGLDAGDALHVAAAVVLGCDELVTSEKPDKAIHRVKSIPVRSIR